LVRRAWKFVEKVLGSGSSHQKASPNNNSNNNNDGSSYLQGIRHCKKRTCISVFLAANIMLRQQKLLSVVLAVKPVMVDIGFHYTRPKNISRIRNDGLGGARRSEHFELSPWQSIWRWDLYFR
jgi:hypothetical protein